MQRPVLSAGLILFCLSACMNPTVEPTITAMPTATTAASTPSPTITQSPPVQPEVILQVTAEKVNCRYGPGTVYASVNELSIAQVARVAGRDKAQAWWYVQDPGFPGNFCWVSASFSSVEGAVDDLPLVQSPPVMVTKATLRSEPERMVVNCDDFPQAIFLEAQLTTNGPALVTFRWEGSTGLISQDYIETFEQAGQHTINYPFQVDLPDQHWMKLHIISPNEVIEQVNIPVSCTP